MIFFTACLNVLVWGLVTVVTVYANWWGGGASNIFCLGPQIPSNGRPCA